MKSEKEIDNKYNYRDAECCYNCKYLSPDFGHEGECLYPEEPIKSVSYGGVCSRFKNSNWA